MTDTLTVPSPALLEATPERTGGAGAPELAKMTPNGRVYVDPLPWCPLLGSLGIPEQGFEIGAEFGSVTTLLNYLPKDRLVKWMGKMAAECAARFHWVRTAFGDAIAIDYWARAGERFRDMAGERGTLVHDVAEDGASIIHKAADALLAGHGIPQRFIEQANVAPYVRALQKFFADWPGIRPIWTEVTVFSRQFGYAGTGDLCAYIPGLGVVWIDWKSSRLTQPKMAMQLAAYRHADYGIAEGRRVPLPLVQDSYIVHLMPGEEGDGAYELLPVDSDFEIVQDIFPAMHAIKRHDHPSKIHKPISPATLSAGLPPAPNLRIVTVDEAVAQFEVHTEQDVLDLCLDPAERLRLERAEVRRWQLDYASDVIAGIGNAARAGNADALHCDQMIAQWYQGSGLPGFSDPRMTDPDCFAAEMQVLVDGLVAAAAKVGVPFGVPEPQHIDFDDLLGQFLDEHSKAAEAGVIVPGPDGSYVPNPRRGGNRLPRNAVTLLRRGRAVTEESWTTPRDEALVEFETALIERLQALPADLMAELDRWARPLGIPNLRLRIASMSQLESVAARIAELQQAQTDRLDRARKVIARTFAGDLDAGVGPVLTLTGKRLAELTDAEIDHVEVLCCALIDGLVDVAVDTWHVTADEQTILGWFASKTEVLKAARAIAADLGMPSPKATARVVEDPVLVAYLALQVAKREESAA